LSAGAIDTRNLATFAQSVLEGRYEFFERDVVHPADQDSMLGARNSNREPKFETAEPCGSADRLARS
jgi:hypothetical protein